MPAFDTPRPVHATIDLAVGAVRLRAGARGTTTVEARPSDPSRSDDIEAADQVTIEFTDDRVVIQGPNRGGQGIVRSWLSSSWGGSVDLTLDLPEGSSVAAKLGTVDVEGTGPLGDCRVRTGMGSVWLDGTERLRVKTGVGDVAVGHVSGHADVITGSGQVELGELTASAAVRNANGPTMISSIDGHLRVKAANGAINVGRASGDVIAKAANGNLSVGELSHGEVVLETQVGDIEVGISDGVAAWLDLDAPAGTVHNDLDSRDKPDRGTDHVKVRARSTLGNILIRRPTGLRHG